MNPDTCGRANSIWIRIRVDVEIFESSKKNLWIKKYPHTSGRGLKLRSHCHFDKVWERHSCDNGKEICQKVRCMFRFFFSVYQSNLLHVFFFLRYLKRMRNRTDFRAKHENSILQLFSFRVKVGKPISNLLISIHAIVDYPKSKVLEDGVFMFCPKISTILHSLKPLFHPFE